MKWSWQIWSNIVWAVWIFVIFMSLELTGYFQVAPWRTLSETVWADGDKWPLVYFVVGGFLCGLTMHFLAKVPLLQAVILGLVVAALSHILDGWPKW